MGQLFFPLITEAEGIPTRCCALTYKDLLTVKPPDLMNQQLYVHLHRELLHF